MGINTRYLGWGVGFLDADNDGWPDILVSNGHVYPEVDAAKLDASYAEHKYFYRNLRNGQFEDATAQAGPGVMAQAAARGCAFGDYDNDGDTDVIVNCVNSAPQLLRCDTSAPRSFLKLRLVGTKSNRTAIGARIAVTAVTGTAKDPRAPLRQIDEVRSGGSYYSQSDLRIHFGLGAAAKADLIEIQWPSGARDMLKDLKANALYVVEEGGRILRTLPMGTRR